MRPFLSHKNGSVYFRFGSCKLTSAMAYSVKNLKEWKGAKAPDHRVLEGQFIRLEPLSLEKHGDQLWHEYFGPGADPKLWDYTIVGMFTVIFFFTSRSAMLPLLMMTFAQISIRSHAHYSLAKFVQQFSGFSLASATNIVWKTATELSLMLRRNLVINFN